MPQPFNNNDNVSGATHQTIFYSKPTNEINLMDCPFKNKTVQFSQPHDEPKQIEKQAVHRTNICEPVKVMSRSNNNNNNEISGLSRTVFASYRNNENTETLRSSNLVNSKAKNKTVTFAKPVETAVQRAIVGQGIAMSRTNDNAAEFQVQPEVPLDKSANSSFFFPDISDQMDSSGMDQMFKSGAAVTSYNEADSFFNMSSTSSLASFDKAPTGKTTEYPTVVHQREKQSDGLSNILNTSVDDFDMDLEQQIQDTDVTVSYIFNFYI